jgi:predicted DNA-binding transcriptional regulator AlpA
MHSNPSHATPWPRGLSRSEAAAYVGLGTTFFDELVGEGKFPKPMKIGKRCIWDKVDLDGAFDSFKDSVAPSERNPWD